MAISELQIALIGAGAVGVAMVWGYNVWQDRQHRKTADRIFNGGQGDALLGGTEGAAAAPAAPTDGWLEPGERLEPRLDAEPDTAPDVETGGYATGDAAADQPPLPALPAGLADEVADCTAHLLAAEAIPAPAVHAMQSAWSGDIGKPLRWLALNDADGAWQAVAADDAGSYRTWAAVLQLVDRRGPVADGELGRFFDGMQQIAQQTAATLELPARDETALRAANLDEFCAALDIQFVLHVVEATGGVFAGTKLRGVAEAAGLALEADGMFHARDADGGELYSVANLGAERFESDTIKSLATHGLTLSLDVPRVTDGRLAFDRMLAAARQLSAALGGVLVDAQRAPLSDAMIDAIRAKTAELQQRMHDGGIPPGGELALRLFS
jgi:hypothetical protein